MTRIAAPFPIRFASALTLLAIAGQASAAPGPRAPSFSSIFFYSGTATGGIDWIGSAIIWLLIGLSVFNVGLIVRSWLAQQPATILSRGLAEKVRIHLQADRRREALEAIRTDRSDLARLLAALVDAAPGGEAAMGQAIGDAADASHAARMRSLEPLSALGQVSPMIGLFGTVYGMIVAFQTIAASGGAADPVLLAGGIGTALVTTFWGLLVAIPALAAYSVLRGRVDASLAEAEREADEVMSVVRSKTNPDRIAPAS